MFWKTALLKVLANLIDHEVNSRKIADGHSKLLTSNFN
jgi:hypothetical protein